jgi:hypothetical protein
MRKLPRVVQINFAISHFIALQIVVSSILSMEFHKRRFHLISSALLADADSLSLSSKKPRSTKSHNFSNKNLAEEAASFLICGLRSSTRATYQIGVAHYLKFCTENAFNPFPTDEVTLALFATSLSGFLAGSSINVYIQAVLSQKRDVGNQNLVVANCCTEY